MEKPRGAEGGGFKRSGKSQVEQSKNGFQEKDQPDLCSFPLSSEASLRRTWKGSSFLSCSPRPPPSAWGGGGGAGQGARGWRAEAGLRRFVSRTEWAMCVRAGPRGLAVLSHEPQKNARIWDVCHQGAGCSGCKVTRAFPGLLQSFGTWGHSNPSCLYCERVRSRA